MWNKSKKNENKAVSGNELPNLNVPRACVPMPKKLPSANKGYGMPYQPTESLDLSDGIPSPIPFFFKKRKK